MARSSSRSLPAVSAARTSTARIPCSRDKALTHGAETRRSCLVFCPSPSPASQDTKSSAMSSQSAPMKSYGVSVTGSVWVRTAVIVTSATAVASGTLSPASKEV